MRSRVLLIAFPVEFSFTVRPVFVASTCSSLPLVILTVVLPVAGSAPPVPCAAAVAVVKCPVDLRGSRGRVAVVAVGDLLHDRVDQRIGGIGVEGQHQRTGAIGRDRADGRAAHDQASALCQMLQRAGGRVNILRSWLRHCGPGSASHR